MTAPRRWAIAVALVLMAASASWAGFTETLPQGTFMLDFAYLQSNLDSLWNDQGEEVPLIEQIDRYEPGSGKQGILIPRTEVEMAILTAQIMYGITDTVSLGVGLPIVLYQDIDPRFTWKEGDYQWNLARAYSESDFWDWAESMGQSKPEPWRGNQGVIGDIQIGMLWRFTDGIAAMARYGLSMGTTVTVALPTGSQPDPEQVISAGTTSWDFHSNGDLGVHISLDKSFKKSLDDRLVLGLDLFHEFLLPHTYTSPSGKENPLMLTYRPYTGKHYTIDGGDFDGVQVQADVVPYKGPALPTWLAKHDASRAAALPPLVTMTFRYSYIHLQQTDWNSNSDIWDYDREKLWRPGYKNMLYGRLLISLLRVGAPLQPYVAYRNLTWIPGKNSRAPNVISAGTRMLLKFW